MADIENNEIIEESTPAPVETQPEQVATEQVPEEAAKTEVAPEAEKAPEEETITKTRSELDAEFAKTRKIAERRARHQALREVEDAKVSGQQNPPQGQTEQQYQVFKPNTPPPDLNSVWDESIGMWIDSNMSVADYANLATQRQQQLGQYKQPQGGQSQTPPANVNPTQQQYPPAVNQPAKPSDNLQDQAIVCDVEYEDFKNVMVSTQPTSTMLEAAATDSEGVKNLYLFAKENPQEVQKISQLSIVEQQQKMWQLNQKMTQKRVSNVKSNATKQPASIKAAGGAVQKSYDEMSYLEKKAISRKEYEDKYK